VTNAVDVKDRLEGVLPAIRSAAEEVDRDASFPSEQVRSLGDAGLLGLIASPDVGGLGAGPREFVDACSVSPAPAARRRWST
jgi:alkylation response protein AidB-like acyl-CoA dehydrogenase